MTARLIGMRMGYDYREGKEKHIFIDATRSKIIFDVSIMYRTENYEDLNSVINAADIGSSIYDDFPELPSTDNISEILFKDSVQIYLSSESNKYYLCETVRGYHLARLMLVNSWYAEFENLVDVIQALSPYVNLEQLEMILKAIGDMDCFTGSGLNTAPRRVREHIEDDIYDLREKQEK